MPDVFWIWSGKAIPYLLNLDCQATEVLIAWREWEVDHWDTGFNRVKETTLASMSKEELDVWMSKYGFLRDEGIYVQILLFIKAIEGTWQVSLLILYSKYDCIFLLFFDELHE